jgi:hypothetical protein
MIECKKVIKVARLIACLGQLRIPEFGLAFALALAALPAAVGAQAAPAGAFVVRISEASVDNEHGATSMDCLLVRPDGRFHLEHRHQQLPSPTARLSVFESSLDSSQLVQLQGIIKNERVSDLPDYVTPPVSMDVPRFSTLIVDIQRGGSVQRSGYWTWHERSPGALAFPADVKKRWQDSEVTLRPVVEWFHEAEGLKLLPSSAGSMECSANAP